MYTRIAILVLTLGLAAHAVAGLEIGAEMTHGDRAMKDVSGKQVSLADVKGENGTVVAFWCNHCPFVKMWRGRFQGVAQDFSDKGFGFIAVNPNDPETFPTDDFAHMRKVATQFDYSFPYVVDEASKLARAFGATKTPHIYVFNSKDELVYVGAIDDSYNEAKVSNQYLREVLKALQAGNEVPFAKTKAFGCSIKFRD